MRTQASILAYASPKDGYTSHKPEPESPDSESAVLTCMMNLETDIGKVYKSVSSYNHNNFNITRLGLVQTTTQYCCQICVTELARVHLSTHFIELCQSSK